MRQRAGGVVTFALAILWATGVAQAQGSPQAPPSSAGTSRLWLVAGGASTVLRGDCQDCEEGGDYLHAGGLLVNVGSRLTSRMDVGAELFWVPATTTSGEAVRATFVLGVVQFRPWGSSGFFLKGGMGMAFVRNWVYDASGERPSFTSKALGLTYGAGWEFRRSQRVGVQVFGSQHVAALGDFRTANASIENVVGNFWSVGAAVVVR